jgi:thymidylate synthase
VVSLIEERTLGSVWLEVCRRILEDGVDATYDGAPMRELPHLRLRISQPNPDDATIAELGDPEWLGWMRRNFEEVDDVAELGGARSYARRLRDYEGRDQVGWVVERLRSDPATRSATITTLQPLTDTTYVPCVSLLDFWRVDNALELVVYAHSLDFGKKAYGNLVELARLQREVGEAIGASVGVLVVHAKSAHVYAADYERVGELVDRARNRHSVTAPSSQ